MENPNFLKQKYNLHNAPEVKKSAERTEKRTGEKVPQNPESQIQNYLDRLEKIILDPDKKQKRKMFENESRPRALMLLREMIMNKYVRPNKEKMAEGAARVEERAARELGIGVQYGEQELVERGNIAVKDLEKSLDNWIAYLSDANEPYPVWFRYYAFRNALDLGDYDKDKGEFTKRSQGSTRLFPDIDRGALAYVEQMIEASKDPKMLENLQKAQLTAANNDVPKNQLITKEKAEAFSKLSFAKQYAEGIKQNGEITPEMREETRGKWVKYQQGTDPTALWSSLQNKGTAWCTKGFATAETQLKGGDFYVYYTLDKQGKPTIPRIAIRMEGQNKISNDVRGVLDSQQNIEGNMLPIMEEKLKEFGPEADRFKKKSENMKKLTEIEKKTKSNQKLNKEDLLFLYEIDSPIEGFGYQRDPRIEEIRSQRNPKEDAPVVFECAPEEIAFSQEEITENTKAYVGPLFPGIFQKDIENIYTSFPERRIECGEMKVGGLTKEELEKEIKNKRNEQGNYRIGSYAQSMMENPDFTKAIKERLKNTETVDFVRLKIKDIINSSEEYASRDYLTNAELMGTAEDKDEQGNSAPFTKGIIRKLGLELLPAEFGPHLRIKYEEVFKREQPMNEYLSMGMKPISDSDGDPHVFDVNRDDDGCWLVHSWAITTSKWSSDDEILFRFRKLET